jgi:hypothetical protein
MLHRLKTVQPYFDAVWRGDKTFEVRKNDRDFHRNEHLLLQEYDPSRPEEEAYSGARIIAEITYVLQGGQFGIEEGHCVLGLRIAQREGQPGWKPPAN